MDVLVGMDLGTSSIKACFFSPEQGRIIRLAQRSYDISTPHPGWAEQDPEIWWQSGLSCLRELLSQDHGYCIRGISFSGQMHGLVLLDKQGRPLRPAVIWPDQRSQAEVGIINSWLQENKELNRSLNYAATGFAASSLLWLKNNEPEIFRQVDKIMLPKDYLRYRLCGNIACESSDASSTLLLDSSTGSWNSAFCQAMGLPESILPELLSPFACAGETGAELHELTGLPSGTPVYMGAADQPAQTLGNGVSGPGTVISNIGTGGQISTVIDQPCFDEAGRLNTFCFLTPDSWVVQGSNLNSGLALKWLRDQCFSGSSFDSLMADAETVTAGSEGLIFLPYLSGERTPHMDPQARAGFMGLTLRHGRAHMVRAVIEGVVMALNDALELIRQQGVPVNSVLASGGGTAHPLWLQTQADVFGLPVCHSQIKEAACQGAALCAGTGAGIWATPEQACASLQQEPQWFLPDEARHQHYRRIIAHFREIYQASQPLFQSWPGQF